MAYDAPEEDLPSERTQQPMRMTKKMQQDIRKALSDSTSLMQSMLDGGYRLDNNEAVQIMLEACIKQSQSMLAYLPAE